ncbi:MAG: DUF1670 domain-containing protein [Nitrospirae bacterium]|nr:MAG: DUF1670 domain-containing protein [Nitrospirota bacterium]
MAQRNRFFYSDWGILRIRVLYNPLVYYIQGRRKEEMKGSLTYWVREKSDRLRSLKLTVWSVHDHAVLETRGLAELRRIRAQRLIDESLQQGARLSYRDLSLILLTSKSTLKRDIKLHGK